jgi:TRAP-type uncharacterized transport system substrate-binding protein
MRAKKKILQIPPRNPMQPDLETVIRRRSRWYRIFAGVAVLAVAIGLGFYFMKSTPPRNLTIAAGPEVGMYYEYAQRYRKILARHGVRLNIRTTEGSVENLALLRDPASHVGVAFIQGGTASREEPPGIQSLGTLFYEPVWVFQKGAKLGLNPRSLDGLRFAVGPEGSGTRKLATDLLVSLGADLSRLKLLDLTGSAAADALVKGDVDVVVIVSAWGTATVHRLLTADGIESVSYPRADAHVALRPYLNKLLLPQGVADLAHNRPPTNLVLIAPKTSLVVRADLHPALQFLLLEAAIEVHSMPGIFHAAGQFPAAEPIDFPLSETAIDYFRSGAPFLQRYLPFWAAVLVAQIGLLLIPVLGIAYPLLRLAPAMYDWGMRRRIYRLYGELKLLEIQMEQRAVGEPRGDLMAELDRLEQKADHMHISTSFLSLIYTMRFHISLIRERLENR